MVRDLTERGRREDSAVGSDKGTRLTVELAVLLHTEPWPGLLLSLRPLPACCCSSAAHLPRNTFHDQRDVHASALGFSVEPPLVGFRPSTERSRKSLRMLARSVLDTYPAGSTPPRETLGAHGPRSGDQQVSGCRPNIQLGS